MLKRTQCFGVPSEVPISPAWMPMTCEVPVEVKVEREVWLIPQDW